MQAIRNKQKITIIQAKRDQFPWFNLFDCAILSVKIMQWSIDAIFLCPNYPKLEINSRELYLYMSLVIYLKTAKQQGQACLITEQWFTELFQY